MAEITLAKGLKIKNRLAGRLAKVQTDIQTYNSVPEGLTGQVDVPGLVRTRLNVNERAMKSVVCGGRDETA
jgi:hypothetical protein